MSGNVLSDFRRIVIKIGSAVLMDQDRRLLSDWLAGLAEDIAGLRNSGMQVLIVTSGAVAIGSRILKIHPRKSRLEELQAAAAAGQVRLVNAYQEAFSHHAITVAQILLTPDDTEIRRRFLNARGTLEKLLEHEVIPVINENDTVATDELRYGDNDRLAARVAQLVMADGLVLLSDIDGFYTADPRRHADAQHLSRIRKITDEMFEMAGAAGSAMGSGGMLTKLLAARIAMHAGCSTVLASGAVERPLHELMTGGKCTVFVAESTPAAARKQWLAGILEVRGELRLDAGAVAALRDGKSLLPVGVIEVVGNFKRGDAVTLIDAGGAELGKGLAAYSSEEASAIRGRQSGQIESILGYRGRSVMVHRDDLVWFGSESNA